MLSNDYVFATISSALLPPSSNTCKSVLSIHNNAIIGTNTSKTSVTSYMTIFLLCRYLTRNIIIISYSGRAALLPHTVP